MCVEPIIKWIDKIKSIVLLVRKTVFDAAEILLVYIVDIGTKAKDPDNDLS